MDFWLITRQIRWENSFLKRIPRSSSGDNDESQHLSSTSCVNNHATQLTRTVSTPQVRYCYVHFTDEELRFREFLSPDQSFSQGLFHFIACVLNKCCLHIHKLPKTLGSLACSRRSLGFIAAGSDWRFWDVLWGKLQLKLILQTLSRWRDSRANLSVCWFPPITTVNILSVIKEQAGLGHVPTTPQTMIQSKCWPDVDTWDPRSGSRGCSVSLKIKLWLLDYWLDSFFFSPWAYPPAGYMAWCSYWWLLEARGLSK